MKTVATGLTDIGHCRSNNEDHLLVDDSLGLYVVSDGIGGETGGEVASHLAVVTVARCIQDHRAMIEAIRDGHHEESRLSRIVAAAVQTASQEVYRTACAFPDLDGMGCTLTVLLMGRRTAAMAHVGDSRLYVRRCGATHQLSTDHNVAQELVELGAIKPEQIPLVWGGRSLTRAVGRRDLLQIEELIIEIEPGDRFILCSDGLSDYLTAPEHLGQLLADHDDHTSAARLIDFARAQGGRDNITAVVVDVETDAGIERAPIPVVECSTGMLGECITCH